MPKFSNQSLEKLKSAHIDLQTLFNEVIKIMDCTVIEGHRNKEDQNKAFKTGNSDLKYPQGKHNKMPSLAVDVAPYPIDWKNINRFYWFGGFVLGLAERLKEEGIMSHTVKFGGDWNHNFDITDEKGLRDLVHFELIT